MKTINYFFLIISLCGLVASVILMISSSRYFLGDNYKLSTHSEVVSSFASLVENHDVSPIYTRLANPWNARITVNYKYIVGDKIYPGQFSVDKTGVSDFKNAGQLYPAGKKLSVYYDEMNPSKSFEKNSEGSDVIMGTIMIIAFSLIFVWSGYNLFYSRKVINFVE